MLSILSMIDFSLVQVDTIFNRTDKLVLPEPFLLITWLLGSSTQRIMNIGVSYVIIENPVI